MTLEDRLVGILRKSARVVQVLDAVRGRALPDWRLFSGGVYQTVWNALTGRDPDDGIKDYDIGYFDPDVSWEAEDRVIKAVAAALPPPLDTLVEVRNQARVHLWFEQKFGEEYSPLSSTDEALRRFVCPAFAVGVRLDWNGAIDVAAPFGLEDMFSMTLRPNPPRPFRLNAFRRVEASLAPRWPELRIVWP